jgi:ech hydrogenase subunit D
MDGATFLARVRDYHEAGWRLAIINVTTVMPSAAPAHGAHGAATTDGPATEPSVEVAAPDAPGVFEVSWGFAKEGLFETIREQIAAGDPVPSISEFFGAAFLYENEIRELFGIDVTGVGVDLKGQLYKTATRVPFSHAAVKARLAANAAATGVKRS